MQYKTIWVLVGLQLLAACGGGGSSNPSSNPGNTTVTLNDVLGVWKYTTAEEGFGDDIYYYQINGGGQIVAYNYHGDSFNKDSNMDCYAQYNEGILSDTGNGTFDLTFPDGEKFTVLSAKLNNNQLAMSGTDNSGDDFSYNYTRDSLDVSAVTLCRTLVSDCVESANTISLASGSACRATTATVSAHMLDDADIGITTQTVLSCNSGILQYNGTLEISSGSYNLNTLTVNCAN